MDVVAASIPIFFLLIVVEVLVARRFREPLYRFNDSIADLSCGILSQFAGLFMVILTYGAFAWLSEHGSLYRVFDLPPWPQGSPLVASDGILGFAIVWPALVSWAVVFVLADLAYYWLHRLSHEVNFLWAGHVVHHSSEEYNLTVALRQSSLHGLVSWVFYMPLAVLGIPWIMFAVCHGINLIYQFWIHTREIDRLGPLEVVMNTPSHHRVHHGVNPKYQDKNYAGVFIVWDKLFGTFVPEEEEPVYGITVPLRTWNPIIANIHVFQEMFRNAWRTRRWSDKLKVIFGPPSWRPEDIGSSVVAAPVSKETFVKFDTTPPRSVTRYVAIQFLVLLLGAVVLLRFAGDLPVYQVVAGGFYIGIGLSSLGSLLEARRWAGSLEIVRLLMLVLLAVGFMVVPRFPLGVVLAVGAFAAASLAWAWRVRPALASTPQPA